MEEIEKQKNLRKRKRRNTRPLLIGIVGKGKKPGMCTQRQKTDKEWRYLPYLEWSRRNGKAANSAREPNIFLSTLLYGSGKWITNVTQEQRLNSFPFGCLILDTLYPILRFCLEKILEKSKIPSMLSPLSHTDWSMQSKNKTKGSRGRRSDLNLLPAKDYSGVTQICKTAGDINLHWCHRYTERGSIQA